jgi:hypothetical protein
MPDENNDQPAFGNVINKVVVASRTLGTFVVIDPNNELWGVETSSVKTIPGFEDLVEGEIMTMLSIATSEQLATIGMCYSNPRITTLGGAIFGFATLTEVTE